MLRLQKATVREILRWASQHPELEVCGLVWASERPGAFRQTVWPLPNVHPDPRQYYRTAPKDVREAFDAMDQQGGTPLAWYHSHPSGKPDPSETDMAGAFNVGMHYLIAYPEAVVDEAQHRPGYVRQWMLSAWECLETGLLVGADYLEVP